MYVLASFLINHPIKNILIHWYFQVSLQYPSYLDIHLLLFLFSFPPAGNYDVNIKFGGVEIPGGQFIVEVNTFIGCKFMHASFKTLVLVYPPTVFVRYMLLVNMMASPIQTNHRPTSMVSPS